MTEVFIIAGGKGGVGTSTICAHLGSAFARKERRVLIIDAVSDLRTLDVITGVTDRVVFTLSDIANGVCPIGDAIVYCGTSGYLSLICGSSVPSKPVDHALFVHLLDTLAPYYDVILFDAGNKAEDLEAIPAARCHHALVVCTPDELCVRCCRNLSDRLFAAGVPDLRLLVNMLPLGGAQSELLCDIDSVIDGVCCQLVGIIPREPIVSLCATKGLSLPKNSLVYQIFETIAQRLYGNYIDLLIN